MEQKNFLTKELSFGLPASFTVDNVVDSKTYKFYQVAKRLRQLISVQGMNKSHFAELMQVQPSIVTKWLSGNHNFTLETLFDIEEKLQSRIVHIENPASTKTIELEITVQADEKNRIDANHLPFNFINYNHKSARSIRIRYQTKISIAYK